MLSYIGLGDDLLLVEVEVQHDFFGGDIVVVILVGVEGDEDCLFGFGAFY